MSLETIICPGHEGYTCGRIVEKTCHFQKRCFLCASEHKKEHRQLMRELYPEKDKKMHQSYREAHRNKANAYSANWNKTHKEYIAVSSHHYSIFKSKQLSQKNYKGMVFFDSWNPDKGGSFQAGAEWIISNLGKRPEDTSLHIIDHSLGFVPGNLEWTHPRKQTNQQMFKIIAQQHHEIKSLKEQIVQLEKRLTEVD